MGDNYRILIYKAESSFGCVCLSPKNFRTVNSGVTQCASAYCLANPNECDYFKKKVIFCKIGI